jgi:DNA-binding MurR/RpiR family transcriptional regulator
MAELHTDTELRELIVKHGGTLPPQQRIIADYLVEHLQTVPFLSIPELAHRIGVSEATIVRFAKRIGFTGFSELKMALVDILQNQLPTADETARAVPDDSNVLQTVARMEITNIERSLEAIDRKVFDSVAEAIHRSSHTYTFGMGVSAHLAELAAYTLTQIGVRARCFSTRYSSPREQLVVVDPEDLVVVLSFPPYSRQTLHMLEGAVERGAATVAVCDRLTAPAAGIADWALPVRSDNMMFTNAVAAVTVVFNALAGEVASSHQQDAIDAISTINRVLSEDENVIPLDR